MLERIPRHVPCRAWLLMMLGLSLCSLACSSGEKLNKVQGKVIHKDQPLAGALVTFHPKAQTDFRAVSSTGMTKEDGTFTLMTGNAEGAPAGDYVVTIICTRLPETGKKSFSTGGVDSEDILQGAYANRNTSKIEATVKSGENTLEPFILK